MVLGQWCAVILLCPVTLVTQDPSLHGPRTPRSVSGKAERARRSLRQRIVSRVAQRLVDSPERRLPCERSDYEQTSKDAHCHCR
ncbi:hypothetical protein SKAU_G00041150 [Synaphobranchus kaupii]|uniref:Secreted protein n=1 Tax=Synaphobranchus kaupii TaxID=118154 RepID=A0A9Q1G2G1_SYNKA|nr:hypothetical protein SKAU_G00041150 [Synaphobranchus kaupii]